VAQKLPKKIQTVWQCNLLWQQQNHHAEEQKLNHCTAT